MVKKYQSVDNFIAIEKFTSTYITPCDIPNQRWFYSKHFEILEVSFKTLVTKWQEKIEWIFKKWTLLGLFRYHHSLMCNVFVQTFCPNASGLVFLVCLKAFFLYHIFSSSVWKTHLFLAHLSPLAQTKNFVMVKIYISGHNYFLWRKFSFI